MTHKMLAALLPALLLAALSAAQPSKAIVPTEEPATRPAGLLPPPATRPVLGSRFESKTAGIAFNAPGDMEQVKLPGPVENVVTYINEKTRSTLKVTRVVLTKPQSLIARDTIDPVTSKPLKVSGLIDAHETQLAGPPTMGKILRKDVINSGKEGAIEVGLIAARYVNGPQFFLRQQALVRYDLVPPTPGAKLGSKPSATYFVFDYTTPSGKNANNPGKEDEIDPSERQAAEVFGQMIDSIELFDLRPLVRDAEMRLDATRTLLFNIQPKKLFNALAADRCFIIWQGGKQIGWSYVVEAAETQDAREGFVVRMRTRTFPQRIPLEKELPPGAPARAEKVDAIAEMFSTPDRKFETFATVVTLSFAGQGNTPGISDQMREFGQTNSTSRRIFEEAPGLGGRPVRVLDEKGNPKFKIENYYTLTVTQFTKAGNVPPVERDLPPYYATQAFAHLLPRLLPLNEPRGYLFAVWVSQQKEIIRRYLDVERSRRVMLGSSTVEAIPVKDRIGLEGVPTYHYFSPGPEARYLGSVTSDTKMAVLVATPEDVKKLDPSADLTAPPRAMNIGGRENK